MNVVKATRNNARDIHAIDCLAFRSPWSEKELLASLNNEFSRYFIAEENGVIVGYIGYYTNGDILNIATLPTFRRRGVGDILVDTAITMARSEDIESLVLEVRESNTAAIELYKKHGFTLVNKRLRYYPDEETALIFLKRL